MQQEPAEAPGLAEAAKHEVEAMERTWTEDWKAASEKLHLAAAALTSYPAVQGYQRRLSEPRSPSD